MATLKDELLKYFATLDVGVLERLKKYSQYIIIPDEDLLTNATMAQMVDKAHSLADSLFPEWTDRGKSDFGEFLIELFALFSEKDFWYINAFANEGIFKKIRSYSNAYVKASTLGYRPETCKGAEASFRVTFAQGEQTTYDVGDLVIDVNGKSFTNSETIQIPALSTDYEEVLSLTEGTELMDEISFSGYNVPLRKSNIDIDSVRVFIDGVECERVFNFGDSSEMSLHFIALPESDGSCSIFFGSDGFGYTPPFGKAIKVIYRQCKGSDGNTLKGEATILECLDSREATSAEMLTDATGGRYAETLTSIKERAPMFFNVKKSATNTDVAEEILNSFSIVHKSKVTTYGNNLYYQVIPASGSLELTATEEDYLNKEFEKYVMMGFNVSHSQNNYVNLLRKTYPTADKVIIEVYVSPGSSEAIVRESVMSLMQDFTNPLVMAEYGGSFEKVYVENLLKGSISGVQRATFKVSLGTTELIMSDFNLDSTEIFRTISRNEMEVRVYAV